MSNTSIETIEFEIVGDSSKAKNAVDELKNSLKELAQGTAKVRETTSQLKAFVRTVSTCPTYAAKTSSGLRRIQSELEKTTASIAKYKTKIADLRDWQSKIAYASAKGVYSGDVSGVLASGDIQISELSETVKLYEQNLERLKAARDSLTLGTAPLADVTEPIRQVAETAKESTASIRQMGDEAKRSTNNFFTLRNAADTASMSFKNILKYAFGIRSIFVLMNRFRSFLVDGIKGLAEYDAQTAGTLSGLKSALTGLKGSLATAFSPILNIVGPILTKFINWLAKAASAVSMFASVLSGRSYFMKPVVTGANDAAGAISDVRSAAKEAIKYLAPFDELNVMSDNSAYGGGGGSGSGSGASSGLSFVKEALGDTGFIGQLALTVNDVLFDWKNLTSENIVAKAIAGLSTIGGAIAGGLIGGLPGVIIGGLAGLSLGILADAVTFNFDGVIDKNEFGSLIASTLAGGILGAAVLAGGGGVAGALITFSIGAALTLTLMGLTNPLKNKSIEEIQEYLTNLDEAFKDTTPGTYRQQYFQHWHDYAERELGAAGTSGGLSFFERLDAEFDTGKYKDKWAAFTVGMLGIPSDQEIKEWFSGVVGKVRNFFTENKIGIGIADFFSNPIGTISDLIEGAIVFPEDFGKQVKEKITRFFNENKIGMTIADIFTNPIGTISDLLSDAIVFPDDFWQKTKEQFVNGWNSVIDSISGTSFGQKISDLFNFDWGDLKIDLTASITDVTDNIPKNKRTLSDYKAHFTEWFNNFKTDPWSYIKGWFNTYDTSKIKTAWSYIKGWFNTYDTSKINTAWSYIKGWFNSWNATKIGSPWAYIKGYFNKWNAPKGSSGGVFSSAWAYVKGYFNTWNKPSGGGGGVFNNAWSYVKAWFTGSAKASGGVFANGKWSPIQQFSSGGIFSSGHWSPIQAYASGGSPFGGQLFIAREAGPELVGTLRGHTAVMNNDQIVASVSAGVARAISSIQFHMTGFQMATVPTYDQGEDTEEMMYRAFMRAIADSDFTFEDDINIDMDGDNIYKGTVRRNKQVTRRTGINPLMAGV